jgi:hypothetical protein
VGVSGELKSVLLERTGRSADQSGRPLGEHDRTYAWACATPPRRPTSVFIEGMSVRQWLESSGCVARCPRDQMGRGSEHCRAATGDVILVGIGPVLVGRSTSAVAPATASARRADCSV